MSLVQIQLPLPLVKSVFAFYINVRPVGQAVKTPPFHGGIASSILARVTKEKTTSLEVVFLRLLINLVWLLLKGHVEKGEKRAEGSFKQWKKQRLPC